MIEKSFSILSTGQLTYEHPVRPIGSATKVTPSYDPYENTQGGKTVYLDTGVLSRARVTVPPKQSLQLKIIVDLTRARFC